MEEGKTFKRLELARTGQFGVDGTELTLKDLREAVETFEGTPPISIGHQMAKEDWFPRFGSILSVELEEDDDGENGTLVGDVEMSEILADAYDQGFYTGWSISLPQRGSDSKRYIHHLAFLGAMPPKIRDLKVLQELKKKESIDMSDCQSNSTFTYVNLPGTKPGKNMEVGMDTKQKETLEFSDEQKEKISRAERIFREGKRDKLKAAVGDLVPEGKMESLLELSDSLCESKDFDFSDDGKKVKKAPVDVLIDIFSAIPKVNKGLEGEMEFSDPTTTEKPIDYDGLAQKF